jgi:ABC-2 type transport system permease protein
MAMATPPDLVAGSATGSIFDLGYRGYDGPRLGRRHAIATLFAHSLKWTFGIGRGGRAKIAPFALAGLTLLPALLAVGIRALAGPAAERVTPITPQNYLTFVQTLIAFFVTAQAPELLGRDQRHHVLTLYFSRALERTDYALAKYGALVCALSIVLLVPQVILLLGMVFASIDLGAGLGEALPLVMPILLSTVIAAAFFSGIGLVIAAFTPRRAFASGAIVATFLVLSGVVSVIVLRGALRDPLRYVALLDPNALLDGLASTLFGAASRNVTVTRSGIDPAIFALGACVVAVATLIALVLRYRRIEA